MHERMRGVIRRVAVVLSLVVLAACDPAGHLRVVVMKNGLGPEREAAVEAQVWEECDEPSPSRFALQRTVRANEFWSNQIPSLRADCVIAVEVAGKVVGRYRIKDVCVKGKLSANRCDEAFLYLALP